MRASLLVSACVNAHRYKYLSPPYVYRYLSPPYIQIPVASMGASIYARVLRHAQVHTFARHAHATVYATQHTQRDTRVGIRDEEVGIRDEELGIGD